MKKLIALSCLTTLLLAGCGVDEPNEEISKPEPVSAATTAATTTEPETEPTTEAVTTKKTKPATTKATTTTAATTTTVAATTTSSSGGTATFTDRLDAYPDLYTDTVKRAWDEIYETNDGCVSIAYATYDIDADGIPELIFKHGTCEADFLTDIYTVDLDARLRMVRQIGGSHAVFARDDTDGDFVLIQGHMGEMSMLWYNMDDNFNLSLHKEYSHSLEDDESYEQLEMAQNVWRIDYISAYSFDKNTEIKSYINYAYSEYEELDGLYIDFGFGWASH
ncbi:MAG: hypothetical protein IKP78_06310 [Ruminococcus sp.]|nr:hypothetical protein [Ruminococcus sp.]